MRSKSREPLSPELILVSPADEAQRARDELADRAEADWENFLSNVRSRPVPSAPAPAPIPEPRTSARRRRPLLLAALVVVAAAAAAAIFWATRDDGSPPVGARETPTAANTAATGFLPARVWSWTPVKGARRYRIRFFRNGQRVLNMRTARPRLVLPKQFTFRPGEYRWTVVPISRAGKAGRRIVDSRFAVAKR
jgi:hypothetical protein